MSQAGGTWTRVKHFSFIGNAEVTALSQSLAMVNSAVASAIAELKENKTLETLLSCPVSRTGIVTSKMVAAGLVSLLVGAAYMFCISRFTSGITAELVGESAADRAAAVSEAAMQQLGLTLGASDYLLLGLALERAR